MDNVSLLVILFAVCAAHPSNANGGLAMNNKQWLIDPFIPVQIDLMIDWPWQDHTSPSSTMPYCHQPFRSVWTKAMVMPRIVLLARLASQLLAAYWHASTIQICRAFSCWWNAKTHHAGHRGMFVASVAANLTGLKNQRTLLSCYPLKSSWMSERREWRATTKATTNQ